MLTAPKLLRTPFSSMLPIVGFPQFRII